MYLINYIFIYDMPCIRKSSGYICNCSVNQAVRVIIVDKKKKKKNPTTSRSTPTNSGKIYLIMNIYISLFLLFLDYL